MAAPHAPAKGYELFSDRNPLAQPLAAAAEQVRANRQAVPANNMFMQWEKNFSAWITLSLDAFQSWRDMLTEHMFFMMYGQPWLQALLGLRSADGPPRTQPGLDSDHLALVDRRIEELKAQMDKGGPAAAVVRGLLYIRISENAADERSFEMVRRIRAEHGVRRTLAEFKQFVREQYLMLLLDESRAVALIPELIKGHENDGPQLYEFVRKAATAGRPLQPEGQKRLSHIEQLFLVPQTAKRERRDAQMTSAEGV